MTVEQSDEQKERAKLLAEIGSLRVQLEETEETLRAIGNGEVDAFVVSGAAGPQVYTLKGAEQPYRVLVETMNEGAATVASDGTILYGNKCLASMLQTPLEKLLGRDLRSFVAPTDRSIFSALLDSCESGCRSGEVRMLPETGDPVPVLISCCSFDLSGSPGTSIVFTDLTQQKRSEDMVASERLARSIIEQAGEAIIVCCEEGIVIRTSSLGAELCGQNPLLKPFNDLFRLRILESQETFSVMTPLQGTPLQNVEVEFSRGERTFHLLLNAKPLRNGGRNKILGCVVTLTDITQRKRDELLLRQSEERYRMLFNSLQEGFCIIEMLFDAENRPVDYRFTEVNPAFAALTGLHEAQGKLMRELVPGHEEHWFGTYGRVAFTGESEHFVAEAKALGRWFEVSAYRIDGEDSRKVAILFTDVTEVKRAEEALKSINEDLEQRVAERTEQLALTVESLKGEIAERKVAEDRLLRLNRLYLVLSEINHAIICTKDQDLLFIEFCRIAVKDGGFKLAWVGLVDEQTGELQVAAAYGAVDFLHDTRFSCRTGDPGFGPTGLSVLTGSYSICNDFLCSPITRPWHERAARCGIRACGTVPLRLNGKVIGALSLYADEEELFDQQQIALLKQIGADFSFALDNIEREGERRRTELALHQETSERLRTLEALREKEHMLIQQSRQAAMGEMISNIAHQWRQPLNTLGLAIQEMKMMYGYGECDSRYMEQSVGKCMDLIQHMSQTIDDFRNYFRPEKVRTEFQLSQVIHSTLQLIQDSFKHQQVEVEIVEAETPPILGYRNEFAQALLNILNNARDALTLRGVKDPKVRITTRSEGGRAIVSIADNAGGISEEVMERIFDPYFTTKEHQMGTGLGLFMSKAIIEKNLAGRLTVRNTGDGAEFTIEV